MGGAVPHLPHTSSRCEHEVYKRRFVKFLVRVKSLSKAGLVSPQLAVNISPTTQCYVVDGDIGYEKISSNPFPGKTEIKRRSISNNL
jgi:hypothetical protein